MRSPTPQVLCSCRDCPSSAQGRHTLRLGPDPSRLSWELRLCETHLAQALEWALDMRFHFLRKGHVAPDPTLNAFVEFFEHQYLSQAERH